MDLRLPKNDEDYKQDILSVWKLNIDNERIYGVFKFSFNGKYGYFSNCTNKENKKLFAPGVNKQLSVSIIDNNIKLVEGRKYSFNIKFDSLSKRIQLHPYIFIAKVHSIRPLLSVKETSIQHLETVVKDIYREKLQQNNPYNIVDMAEAVDALAIDIYSENKRFIYELIQNADDAAHEDQAELSIEIIDDYVIISHNGRPFDERDLRGLCGIGRGTKQNDATKTGYKGIGFKSVFGQKDGLVFVRTEDLFFKFDRDETVKRGWYTKWGNQQEWEYRNGFPFKTPWQLIPVLAKTTGNIQVDKASFDKRYSVKTIIKIENPSELQKDIQSLFQDARFILFLRKLKKIRFKHLTGEDIIEKTPQSVSSRIETLKLNDSILSNWYVKTWTHSVPSEIKKELQTDLKSPKKLQNIERTELAFALRLNDVGNEIKRLDTNESNIYTYLPTTVKEYGFTFLVNSNFLVDASREKIHKDRIWNKWLFKVIGYELVVCCSELASNPNIKGSYLKILLDNYYEETDHLRKWFNEGLKKGINTVPLVLNNSRKLIKVSNALLDETGITKVDFISRKNIVNYLSSHTDLKIVEEENLVGLFKGLEKLKNYGLISFDDAQLKKYIQSELFLEQVVKTKNFELLQFLKKKEEEDKTGEWNYIIRNTPFILSTDGKLEKIPLVCFPISEFRTDFGSENTLIEKSLFKHIQKELALYDWLSKLGVSEPSEIAFLEKEIIGKIENIVNDENWLQIAEFLMRLHIAEKLTENHYNDLQGMNFKTNKGFFEAKECFLHKDYKPYIDFSLYLPNLPVIVGGYISKYDAYEWKSLFVKISVSDDINFTESFTIPGDDIDKHYKESTLQHVKSLGHTYPHLLKGGRFIVSYFSFFIETTKFDYAKVFWNRLIEKFTLTYVGNRKVHAGHQSNGFEVDFYKLNGEGFLLRDLMPWGYFGSVVYVKPYLLYLLREKKLKCIPTVQGKNVAAEKAISNSNEIIEVSGKYLPVIDAKTQLSKDWIKFIGLKQELRLSDYLIILKSITQDLYSFKIKKENIKRLGLIYNKLIASASKFTVQQEAEIRQWASNNNIVCSDLIPRRNNEVYWLRVEGFEDTIDKIPALLIPPNLIFNEHVEHFFNLLGIHFVDDCDYKTIRDKLDNHLKIKVLEILPIVCLILLEKLRIVKSDQYLLKILDKLKLFKFYHSDEISLLLNYKEEKIKGANVDHYLTEKALYFTSNWRNPIERYAISKYIGELLNAKGLEQEIQLLLELSNNQFDAYLDSQSLSLNAVRELNAYKELDDYLNQLNEKANPPSSSKPQDNNSGKLETDSIEPVDSDSEVKKDFANRNSDFRIDDILSKDDILELEELMSHSLSGDEMANAWIVAAFKAIGFYENLGYDLKAVRINFENVIQEKSFTITHKSEHKTINVFIRSALSKLLYLKYHIWIDIENTDTELYVVSGDQLSDQIVYNSQKEIAEITQDPWVLKLNAEDKKVELNELLKGEFSNIERNKYKEMQFLIRLPGNEKYNSIFSSFKNKDFNEDELG